MEFATGRRLLRLEPQTRQRPWWEWAKTPISPQFAATSKAREFNERPVKLSTGAPRRNRLAGLEMSELGRAAAGPGAGWPNRSAKGRVERRRAVEPAQAFSRYDPARERGEIAGKGKKPCDFSPPQLG